MKRIGAADRTWAPLSHDVADPVRGIGRHMGDLAAPLDAQDVEEPPQGGGVTTRRGPHQPAAVVINHHRQIPVVALIGDLIDADPAQTGEPVEALVGVGPDPGHDRPDGAPGDPHQLAHRGFRTGHRQPGHRVIEGVGVPGVVTRPRHQYHRRAMLGAVHPRRLGLQYHLHRAPIQAPPPAPTRTPVIAGRPAAATPTPPRNATSRPHPRHHQGVAVGVFLRELLKLDVLNHRALVDTQQRTP